jgi:hypothetical protein
MRPGRLAIATIAVSISIGASAQAAPLIVGSPLTQSFTPTLVRGSATVANAKLPEAGTHVTSPVNGRVTAWNVIGAEGGPFKLRLLRSTGPAQFIGAGTSAPATPGGLGLQTFPTSIPIQVGDLVAVDNAHEEGDRIGTAKALAGSGLLAFLPQVTEGVATFAKESENGREVAFNAVVKPAPALVSVSPRSGSFKGGTAVTITGTDLDGATAVSFGGIPAQSFTVNSEIQITAVTPATKGPGTSDVTVTTFAGTSPMPSLRYRFNACIVPKVKGRNLKKAKARIRKAGCRIGAVKRRNGVTAKAGEVVKQGPKPGRTVVPGTKVNITLG